MPVDWQNMTPKISVDLLSMISNFLQYRETMQRDKEGLNSLVDSEEA